MSYLSYVAAAYAVFAGVLAIDWLAGRLAIARAQRQARGRAGRSRPRTAPTTATELER